MNNKKIGNSFEREWCKWLHSQGHFVHFVEPKKNGTQPFDVWSIQDGVFFAYDCKTVGGKRFALSRVEENQRNAFQLLWEQGISTTYIVIKNESGVYRIPYLVAKRHIENGDNSLKVTDYEIYRVEGYNS